MLLELLPTNQVSKQISSHPIGEERLDTKLGSSRCVGSCRHETPALLLAQAVLMSLYIRPQSAEGRLA